MNDSQRHQLVGAVLRSGALVQEKSASASDDQQELLNAGWPKQEENLTKKATLSRMLATGAMVEEAEAAPEEAAA